MKLSRSFTFGASLVLSALICSCSSTTEPGTPQPTGTLVVPTTIEFGSTSAGRWHDTTFTVSNTTTGAIKITSFGFSASGSSKVQDTIDALPITVDAGKTATLHVQILPADSGALSVTDTIHFTMGSMAMTTSSLVKANSSYSNPGAGSIYTYHVTTTDTNGVEESQGDSTYTVLSSTMSFEGKTNVIQMLNPSGDTAYYKVESNGNVSEYFQPFDLNISQPGVTVPTFHVMGQWIVVPTGSHSTESLTLYDSIVDGIAVQNGVPVPIQAHLLLTAVSDYSGPEAINGHNSERAVTTSVGQVTVSAFGNVVQEAAQTQVGTMWFVPKLRFFSKRIIAVTEPFATRASSTTEVLASYNFK